MKSRPAGALAVLIALLVAAVALVGVELGKGAASSGPTVTNPCKPRAPFPGSGLAATIQRIVLDGLDGAACSLHTTREELVLSLGPESDVRPKRWDEHTIEIAVRSGLRRSVDEAERRGDIPPLIARAARRVVADAPIDVLIRGGIRLSDLIP